MIAAGVIDENGFKDPAFRQLVGIVDKLIDSLSDKKFYYSIPIKSKDNIIYVNDQVSGKTNKLLHDKFYINTIPESGRLLINLRDFMSPSELKTTRIEASEKIEEPAVEPATIIENEEVNVKSDFSKLNIEKNPRVYDAVTKAFNYLISNTDYNNAEKFSNLFNTLIQEELINTENNQFEQRNLESIKTKLLNALSTQFGIQGKTDFAIFKGFASQFGLSKEIETELRNAFKQC